MKEHKVIVIKSTVPVGSARLLERTIRENQLEVVEFSIVSNPEFLRRGSGVQDFLRPDRVILGSDSALAIGVIKDIYSRIYRAEISLITTNHETAEMIKYASNAMLALRISFINEIANLCDKVGADIHDVARAVGMDKRIGPKFLHPGPGFGGPCLPKDMKALNWLAKDHEYDFKLGQAIVDVNEHQKDSIVQKAEAFFGSLKDKKVTVLGLVFKPDTDDTHEAPALSIIKGLKMSGAKVYAYDPVIIESANKVINEITFCENVFVACKDAFLAIVVTEWNEFRNLDFQKLKEIMAEPNIFDTRNMYNPEQLKDLGYCYLSIGRGSHRSNPMC